MSAEARRTEYSQLFEGESRIEDIHPPPLAELLPELAGESLSADLHLHNLRFKICLNYDPVAGWFYDDIPRIDGCGKLIFAKAALARLRRIVAKDFEFSHVVLDIHSYFTPLARITLEVRDSKLKVGPVVDSYISLAFRKEPKHEVLNHFLTAVAADFKDPEIDITNGKQGFTFDDLERLASEFRPMPTSEENIERGRLGYTGPWSAEDENPGYVAFLSDKGGHGGFFA
ncbi:hypothetical protein LTR62_001187 [Meristemomyces frigidus]|uniref:Uncharacterized protein n=1 Tax=Meristemomyces frigidus TaxID=1508187 RepID=A0AAN7YSP4_9PEZI|nr:hypothetical protein LTR62_001187 [Meristemomyces frigidus]